MKKSIFFLLIFVFILRTQILFAEESPYHRWGIGFATGGGYETLGDNDFFAHFGPSIYYRFPIPISLRLSGGAIYLRTPDYNDFHEFISLSGLWHIVEKKPLFRPYLLAGIDVMPSAFDADLHAGLGNIFTLNDHIDFFIESAFGSDVITALQNNDPARYHIRASTGVIYKF